MLTSSSVQYYQQLYHANKSLLPGAKLTWLQQLREAALQTFSQQGFPTKQDEDWKYTSVKALEQQHFLFPPATNVVLPADASTTDIIIQDGKIAGLGAVAATWPKDAIITDLATAASDYPYLLAQYLGKNVDTAQPGFNALNTAFMQNGLFIYIPEKCHIAAPLVINYYNNHHHTMTHLRNVIIVDNAAQLTVVEAFQGSDTVCYFTNIISEMYLNDQARMQHYKLQYEGCNSFHIGKVVALLQHQSDFTGYSFSFGGKLVRSETQITFNQTNAWCQLNGLYLAKDQQHIDHHTSILHAKAASKSIEYYKGILNDKATAVFNGKVLVAKGAQHSDASQYNKNLLLSPKAQINTKPQLEIFADDVKCAHGATVGQLDEEALFYLRSRGISAADAQHLLIYAFADDIIASIDHSAIKQRISDSVVSYLGR